MANHESFHRNYDLDLQDKDFRLPEVQFSESAIKTMQSYENRNQRINSFRLWMQTISHHPLAKRLIINAIKLGATDLTLRIRENVSDGVLCILPNQVLNSETLARLIAIECQIIFGLGKKEVRWSNLKSLTLSHVTTTGDFFCDLISKCASIEEITLDCTRSLRKHGEQRRRTSSSDSMIQLHKLKSLQLIGLDSRDYIYRHDLWPKFPWLKELMIWDHNSDYNWKGLRICSRSLELIALYTYGSEITNGKFDVPNIRKFKVVGVHLPQLVEFKTSSTNREWESDIQVQSNQHDVSWLSPLSKLLRTLSPSRISLSVCMTYSNVDQYTVGVHFRDGLPLPEVENLEISGDYGLRFSAFLKALLKSCCPNCISVDTRFTGNVNLEGLFQRLGYSPCERHDLSDDQQYLIKFQRIL